MKVVGLTGGTGSGKSMVSRFLKSKGAAIVDADAIAHEIIEKGKPAYTEIVQYFGQEILDESGAIVRRRLGDIVFLDSKKLKHLNQCTHHYIHQEIVNQIANEKACSQGGLVILDAPLFDDCLARLCDEVWVVFAKEEARISRIMARDNITFEQAKNRVRSQPEFKFYQKYATNLLDNNQDEAHLLGQVNTLLRGWKGLKDV